jgi:hypothetical protein
MNDDELWAAIDAQRLRTADLLETLAPTDWTRRSLCEGWTVRDVAGHLTLQQMTLADGDRSALPTEQIIAEIRGMVGSRRHNAGLTGRETLIDIVVHGQDMAVPLGRSLPVPAEVAATAASRMWDCRASRSGRRKLKVFRPLPDDGLRLVATDIDWSVGAGAEIRGPVLALLLLLTGRSVVLPQLDGPGASVLTERLTTVPT